MTSGNRLIAELILAEKLDREITWFHNLTVQAFDGDQPFPKTGLLNVHVIVTDSNDNTPIFTPANYNVSVPENLPPKSAVVTVLATDNDAGVNGDVSYR